MTRMTVTRGGRALRVGQPTTPLADAAQNLGWRASIRCGVGPYRRIGYPLATQAAALFCIAFTLAGCIPGSSPPPVSALPTTAAACEAMRPAFPITYSGKSDTEETVRQVRVANARFAASCP